MFDQRICSFERGNGYTIIALQPELDGAQWSSVDQIGSRLEQRLRDTMTDALVVDLSDLDGMGSALVALIVRLWKCIKSRDGRLIVVSRHSEVRKVLQISGLDSLWTIVSSVPDGIRELGFSPGRPGARSEYALLAWVAMISAAIAVMGVVGTSLAVPATYQIPIVVSSVLAVACGLVSATRFGGRVQLLSFAFALTGLLTLGSVVL